jgi:drug/metabolite transporter (DMT)-like permease
MPISALLLVLLGALIHAGWNIVAKKAHGDARFTFFTYSFMAAVWAPVAIWLGWNIVPTWGLKEWALITASGFVNWVYFVCLLTGYRKSDLTIVYPLARGSGPLLSSLIAVIVFGEQISPLGALGITSVVLGVFLIAGGPAFFRASRNGEKRSRVKAGMFWGFATGALIASYTILDAYAVKVMAVSPILFAFWCNILRLPYAIVPILRDVPEAKRLWKLQWRYAAIVAIFSPVAYVCVLYAVQMAPVSHVAPAREVSMLFAALIGGQLLGEGDRGLRIVGACAIALGVMALAFG